MYRHSQPENAGLDVKKFSCKINSLKRYKIINGKKSLKKFFVVLFVCRLLQYSMYALAYQKKNVSNFKYSPTSTA